MCGIAKRPEATDVRAKVISDSYKNGFGCKKQSGSYFAFFENSCLIVTPLWFARMLSVNTKCADKKLHCVDISLLGRRAFCKNVSRGQWRGVKREFGTRWSGVSTPLEFTYFSL